MLNGLSLFSGIGGIDLALGEWVRPVAYCEIEPYCQGVLLSRMRDGQLPTAPIWDDVSTLRGDRLPPIDIIYGGFPCQDLSAAGAGRGLAGERSGLYWQIERLVRESRPQFVFLENVPAIRTRGLNAVIQSLVELGYDCRWTIVSAAEVGAPHLRKRWFLLAHARCEGCKVHQGEHSRGEGFPGRDAVGSGRHVGYAACELSHGGRTWPEQDRGAEPSDPGWWESEPAICRVVDGLQFRVDRLRALGNAVVPLQAREAFMRLSGLKGDE